MILETEQQAVHDHTKTISRVSAVPIFLSYLFHVSFPNRWMRISPERWVVCVRFRPFLFLFSCRCSSPKPWTVSSRIFSAQLRITLALHSPT